MFIYFTTRQTKNHHPESPFFSACVIGHIIIVNILSWKRQQPLDFVINHLAEGPSRGFRDKQAAHARDTTGKTEHDMVRRYLDIV
jgi:hypothetical protein